MNKTDRKNKTNLNITWPEHGKYFTVKELLAINPDFVEITLRVRVDNAIKKDKTVAMIGYRKSEKGRPSMILSMNPVSQEFLDKAYNQDGIQKPEPTVIKPVISVLEVNTTPISTTEQVATDIPVNVPAATETVLTNS